MEIHKRYDLRSKKYLDSTKKDQINADVRKVPEKTSKKTTENVNTIVKKAEANKGKISQPNNDLSCPSTSTSYPEKTILSKAPTQDQHIKNVEKFMADKADVNMSKTLLPFSFEGEISKIKINIPLIELVTRPMYRS